MTWSYDDLILFRDRVGFTQKQLADAAGYTRQQLSYWKTKGTIPEKNSLRLDALKTLTDCLQRLMPDSGELVPIRVTQYVLMAKEKPSEAFQRLEAFISTDNAQAKILLEALVNSLPLT